MHNKSQAEDGKFSTSDLYFAAYLQTIGVPMVATPRNGNGKVSFIFDVSVVNLNELRQAWFSQTGKIPALPYANNIKTLKSICHMS